MGDDRKPDFPGTQPGSSTKSHQQELAEFTSSQDFSRARARLIKNLQNGWHDSLDKYISNDSDQLWASPWSEEDEQKWLKRHTGLTIVQREAAKRRAEATANAESSLSGTRNSMFLAPIASNVGNMSSEVHAKQKTMSLFEPSTSTSAIAPAPHTGYFRQNSDGFSSSFHLQHSGPQLYQRYPGLGPAVQMPPSSYHGIIQPTVMLDRPENRVELVSSFTNNGHSDIAQNGNATPQGMQTIASSGWVSFSESFRKH